MSGGPIDPTALTAIDVHVHTHASVHGTPDKDDELKSMAEYFGAGDFTPMTVRDIAGYYRERSMACVVFTVDDMSSSGRDPVPTNEEIAELAAENADVVMPFASIDPARGRAGAKAARRLVEDYGVRGFKFHPRMQEFYPTHRAAYPLYEVIAEQGTVALFHTGHTGVGAGTPGGGGIRLKYSNPMFVDDVAVDFPEMPIILAHPSFPWQDEALSVAMHKATVHIDLSGWSAKYFPPPLLQYVNTLLRDKMLCGSGFPMITPERWMADFEKIDIRPEVRPLILKDNAARLFGLAGDGQGNRRR